MKKLLSVTLIMAVMLALSFFMLPQKNIEAIASPEAVNSKVVTVADNNSSASVSKVLEARFLNMLNHNFVYNEAFDTEEAVVNNSVIALIDKRDSLNEDFIAESYIADYAFNMYGIENINFAEINKDFPKEEGFVYIIPRGYTVFDHDIISVSVNEDGSYTVKTKVSIDAHDSENEYSVCTSLFVENSESQFGFNLISAAIGDETVNL